MSGELEESHDANDREELEDVCVLQMAGEPLQDHVHVEAERGNVVDDVDARLDEVALARRGHEPHHDLESEPRVADALDVEEGNVRVRLRFVQHPRRRVVRSADGEVFDHGHSHVRVCLQAERDDTCDNEKHRQESNNLKTNYINLNIYFKKFNHFFITIK